MECKYEEIVRQNRMTNIKTYRKFFTTTNLIIIKTYHSVELSTVVEMFLV